MGAWDKAIDLYTEWVKKEKRWPLALPLSVFGAFLFFQKYYNLKFDETVWHWSFLLFCGIVIVISGKKGESLSGFLLFFCLKIG